MAGSRGYTVKAQLKSSRPLKPIGIMEKKMETTLVFRVYIGVI